MNPLVLLLIQQSPEIIQFVRELFRKENPDVPPPTSDQVIQALHGWAASAIAKDDAWLAEHPDPGADDDGA